MPEEWIAHLPQIIVGMALAGFAWGFKGWSRSLEKTSDKILNKLEQLTIAFNEHRLLTEKRVTKVEAELSILQKIIDKLLQALERGNQQSDDPKN